MSDSPDAKPLGDALLRNMDHYWQACNYFSADMISLRDNPLLRESLKLEQIKNRLLGHWGSDPRQSVVLVHLDRVISGQDLNVIFISGPGHGAPATLSHAYLEGGTRRFFRQFSFPGGIGSHCTLKTPGSIL